MHTESSRKHTQNWTHAFSQADTTSLSLSLSLSLALSLSLSCSLLCTSYSCSLLCTSCSCSLLSAHRQLNAGQSRLARRTQQTVRNSTFNLQPSTATTMACSHQQLHRPCVVPPTPHQRNTQKTSSFFHFFILFFKKIISHLFSCFYISYYLKLNTQALSKLSGRLLLTR